MRFASLVPSLSLLASLLVSTGCAQVLGIDDTTGPDGSGGGGGSAGSGPITPSPGSCTEDKSYEGADAVSIKMNMITFAPPNAESAGIQVEAYNNINSFGLFRDPVFCGSSDEKGQIDVKVPGGTTGFNGFFIVKGTGQETFFYFFSPPRTMADPPFTFLTITNADWTALRDQVLGLPNKSDTSGQVTINALTIDNQPLAGVKFEIDNLQDGEPFFFTNEGAPALARNGATQTAASGFGGFFNVPAAGGSREVRMKDVVTQELLGSVRINILAGTWTTMQIRSNKPIEPAPTN